VLTGISSLLTGNDRLLVSNRPVLAIRCANADRQSLLADLQRPAADHMLHDC
jgi:hypothetical protein